MVSGSYDNVTFYGATDVAAIQQLYGPGRTASGFAALLAQMANSAGLAH
jgi:hypothetical protein